MPIPKKKDRRGANRSTSRPARTAERTVLDPVREGEGELLHRGRPRLLHVVAGDRNGVEARHRLRGEADDVGHDAHRRLGRVDEGVADHELLEDVVLHRAGKGGPLDPLLFRRRHEHREHREHRPVHGHRHRHAIEGDPLEESFHVLDGVDRDPRLADIARHPRVVGVVAPVGGEIEGARRGRSDPPRDCAGRMRWTPPRWSSPRTGAASRPGRRTSTPADRAGTGPARAGCRGAPISSRSEAV